MCFITLVPGPWHHKRYHKELPASTRMSFRIFILIFCLLVALCAAQDSPDPSANPDPSTNPDPSASEAPILSPGKRYWEMAATTNAATLQRLHRYTCIQHVNRYVATRRDRFLRRADTVRLQVSTLGEEERYALPGDKETVSNPRELVPTGMVGTGAFQGYMRTIFLHRALEKLEFLGADGKGPQSLLRFRFVLNTKTDPLLVQIGKSSASVPGRGEFWVHPSDMLVRRIAIESAEPIRTLNVRRVLYVMDWAPVTTSAGSSLLPQSTEMWMVFQNGEVSRNDITLAQCREFQAESRINFGTEGDQPFTLPNDEEDDEVTVEGYLPSNMNLEIEMQDVIPLATASVGDTFRARLSKPVMRRRSVLLPQGAEVLGRIRRLDHFEEPVPHTLAWLEFTVVNHQGTEYTFLADMVGRDELPGLIERVPGIKTLAAVDARAFGSYQSLSNSEPTYRSVPGVGSFVFQGELPTIPVGYHTRWKTISPRP